MQITWNWAELCGPNDFVPFFRPGYVLSICAEMSVIRLPILLILLLTSAYYCGHLSTWITRTRREIFVLRWRAVMSGGLSLSSIVQLIWEVYEFSEKRIYPIENLVLVIQCFTWLIHTLYILYMQHQLGENLRGPKIVIIAWVLSFFSSIFSLRSNYVAFSPPFITPIFQVRLWFTIINLVLHILYFITLFFKEDIVRIRQVNRLRFLAQVNLT